MKPTVTPHAPHSIDRLANKAGDHASPGHDSSAHTLMGRSRTWRKGGTA